jgi:hypothetical protein
VNISDCIPAFVYFALPYLSACAYRRHWTDITLLDQSWDVITVAIMVAYTAIRMRILLRRGEIKIPISRFWWSLEINYFTLRRGDNSKSRRLWPRMTNHQHFCWFVASYPIMCAVGTFIALLPRVIGRT